ncbi:putative elongation factor 1-gamma [Leptomonas pyrrhocoris]|uniref:Putative elongation factor 1-gamma n=1 Tax=Leptomonas pyrrhocoris TaxID=157538 RepID=A0A0M9G354_LEPPY|nr:putative elongation factor 1-gamma [Leptomonas pyrrhocoris]KPA81186.1 putative elongation factor 1-gamma [Leptomonas pyrrhocoris]|eukprot:XP_015659625.1 putative elongation factor 1-gamma [Leptomonas pyrrhocoris]
MQLLYQKNPENAPAQKILAAAAYTGVELTPVPCDENKTSAEGAERALGDPCGEYPVLEVGDGADASVFGANSILRYVARAGVEDVLHPYGRTPFEASQVDMWLDFASTEIDAANMPYIDMSYYKTANDVPADALDAVRAVLAGLEEVLSVRTFLVGERMTIADIAVAFSIQWVYRCNRKHGDTLAKEYRAVYRHYNTVMRSPKIQMMMRKEGAVLGPLRA